MRKTKPPVGWEHVKNCFPVPNELLDFDLPGGSIAVYIFLLRHADRRTGQCHPSTATMAKNLHYCRNTVASYVRLLEERGLIVTEHTKIITKNGIKKNVNAYYFGEIGVEVGNEPDILICRRAGFAALERQPRYLHNAVFHGSYDEDWTLRKVLRRFVWHDRIHGRAMWRMACALCGSRRVADPYRFA